MSHEISPLDISDRQLQASNAQSRATVWTDIGEAQVIHTIFGKAKVRIIHKHDQVRRALLLTAVLAMALAAVAWQGWFASRQTHQLQRTTDPLSTLSTSVQETVSDPQAEYIPQPATLSSVKSKSSVPPPTGISKPAISQYSAPQQPIGLKGAVQMPVKPVTAQPQIASPRAVPLASNNNPSKNQTDMQPGELAGLAQPVAPAAATLPAPRPAADKPATIAPPAEPTIKQDTSVPSPAGNKQSAEPVSAQP